MAEEGREMPISAAEAITVMLNRQLEDFLEASVTLPTNGLAKTIGDRYARLGWHTEMEETGIGHDTILYISLGLAGADDRILE